MRWMNPSRGRHCSQIDKKSPANIAGLKLEVSVNN